MKYSQLIRLLPLTLTLVVHADVKSDIGYTELQQEFGAALPDGSNLTVLQVDGPDSSRNWRPSPSGGLAYLKMSYPIDPIPSIGYASHATAVANYLANSSTSVLPRLGELQVASCTLYPGLSLRTGMFVGPKPATWDLENHSYEADMTNLNLNALQLMDFRINQDQVAVFVSLPNSTGSMVPLWGNSYHTITVGTATGRHSRGGTNLEGSGRMKPDLVGTATYTSYCTPIVASAAGVLIGETKRTAALAAAKDPRTIKALLMAGATKEEFPAWAQTSAQPLDRIYGAGQVHIGNSYRMLLAGRQPAGTAWRSVKGWDLGTSGTSAVYYFEVPAGQTLKFSTVLTWHRVLTATNTYWVNFASTLPDLNLRLRNSNASFALGTVVAESTSALDNVEHIYRAALPAGYYALEVSGPAGTPYGLAWNGLSSVPPVVTAPAITAQPAALAVTEGQAAKFSVTATGSSLTYQWAKDSTAISGATAASYSIAATTTASAGSYSVTVRNSAGAVNSNSVALTIATKVAVPGELTPEAYSARGQNGTTEGIAKLFDGATSTKWLDFSGTTWVQVSFASAQSIATYSLTSANDNPVRDPAAWTLSGSNDGTTWTALDLRSGEVFASRFLRRDFALPQPSAAYLHYRLDLTAKSGSITQLAELRFTAAVATAPTTPVAPATTVELLPSGITAHGENGTKEGVANLLDHATATKWLDFSGTTWVQVSFATPRALEAYSLTSANDSPVRDPATWTLRGSNDGVTWTAIESRSSEVFASRFQERDFVLTATSAAYLHYRLDMTAKSGTITQLSGLEFWGK